MPLQFNSIIAESEINVANGYTCESRNLFDVFVLRLFRRSDFDMLFSMTPRNDIVGLDPVRNSYYEFWHKRTGHTFWIKCDFGRKYDEKTNWFPPYLFNNAKQFQEDVWPEEVFMVLGFGTQPLKPSLMLCVPLNELQNICECPNNLEKYRRSPAQPFAYQEGHLI